MENKECVIIPLKEYNALKERIKELERDHPDIDIEWGYSHERYGYFYSNRGILSKMETFWLMKMEGLSYSGANSMRMVTL